jgi:hypothetical protein
MPFSKLGFWTGPERRERHHKLLPLPDRRGIIKPNGGHRVPEPSGEAERAAIEQASRAFRLPRFMKPRIANWSKNKT